MEGLTERLRRLRGNPLAQNSLILFFSEGMSSVLMILTGLLMARLLGVAEFGKFNAALAFAAVVAILVDSGMGMVAAKDIAKGGAARQESGEARPSRAARQESGEARPSRAARQLNEIFSWRLGVILAACVLAPLAACILLPAGEVREVAFWLTPGVLLVGITDFFCWIFKGARRAKWCAGLQLSSRALLLILSVWALTGPRPITMLIVAYAVSGASMTVLGLYVLARSLHAVRLVRPSPEFFAKTLPSIYKMGVILILSVAFTRVDLMIVARLRGDVEAGFFGAAGRVLDALRLLPMVVYSVYMPVFSSLHDKPVELRARFEGAHAVLLRLSVAIAIIGSLFAAPLFRIVLGPQYEGSAACFQPLVWSCVLMFSNILMFSLLYAINDHRTPIIAITGAILLEITLDFLWVPQWGGVGAAWARLAAELFNAGTLAWGLLHKRVISFSSLSPFRWNTAHKEALS